MTATNPVGGGCVAVRGGYRWPTLCGGRYLVGPSRMIIREPTVGSEAERLRVLIQSGEGAATAGLTHPARQLRDVTAPKIGIRSRGGAE